MPAELAADLLSDSLRETVFRKKNIDLFKKLTKETHFNRREVEALAIIHRKICETIGPMSRLIFRDVFHSGLDFTENLRHLMVDRLFGVVNVHNTLHLEMESWIRALSTILRGTLEEQIRFVFKVYNSMGTSKLKKHQIFPLMRGCLIKLPHEEDPDDAVKDMIELMLKKLDVDRDGVLSENDFRIAVKDRNVLFLECMGPVFPSRDIINGFLNTFTNTNIRF